jgi:methylated-DNA-[protein]-cysteine S-methyltransferase
MSNFYTKTSSPLGDIVLTSSGKAITGLYTCEHSYFAQSQNGINNPEFFQEAIKQLDEYFQKKRIVFNLPLSAIGTQFQQSVWEALNNIPYGTTTSYGEIAKLLNKPNASRAVGSANSKNPICIIVPCHRIVGANQKLTGYAGGIKTKQWLIEHEAIPPNPLY